MVGETKRWEADSGVGLTAAEKKRELEYTRYGRPRSTTGKPSPGGGFREKIKHLFRKTRTGLHVSVSVSFGRDSEPAGVRSVPGSSHGYLQGYPPGFARSEMTLRIKNNPTGTCVFEVLSPPPGAGTEEVLVEIRNLKTLFPGHGGGDKKLRDSLVEWNKIFQAPPQHWVVNFVPRAYLRRGWGLAEEVWERLHNGGGGGTRWRVEYEPIGGGVVVVGEVDGEGGWMGEEWKGGEKEVGVVV